VCVRRVRESESVRGGKESQEEKDDELYTETGAEQRPLERGSPSLEQRWSPQKLSSTSNTARAQELMALALALASTP